MNAGREDAGDSSKEMGESTCRGLQDAKRAASAFITFPRMICPA